MNESAAIRELADQTAKRLAMKDDARARLATIISDEKQGCFGVLALQNMPRECREPYMTALLTMASEWYGINYVGCGHYQAEVGEGIEDAWMETCTVFLFELANNRVPPVFLRIARDVFALAEDRPF